MRNLTMMVLVGVLAGCVYVPVHSDKVISGVRPDAEVQAFLATQDATIDTLPSKVGAPPDVDYRDIRVLAYRWTQHAGFLLAGSYGGGAAGFVDGARYLLVAYDTDGRVQAHELIDEGVRDGGSRRAAVALRHKAGSGTSHPVVLVHAYMPKFRRPDGQRCDNSLGAELRLDGQLVASLDRLAWVTTAITPGLHQLAVTSPGPVLYGWSGRKLADGIPLAVDARVDPVYVRVCYQDVPRSATTKAGSLQSIMQVDAATAHQEMARLKSTYADQQSPWPGNGTP